MVRSLCSAVDAGYRLFAGGAKAILVEIKHRALLIFHSLKVKI